MHNPQVRYEMITEKMTGKSILMRWPPVEYEYTAPTGEVLEPAKVVNARRKYFVQGGNREAYAKYFYQDSRPCFTMRLKFPGDVT